MKQNWFSLDYYRLKRLKRILKKINARSTEMAALTDRELQKKTTEFRERLAQGESLDSLLPEAFAVVREADRRVLGMFPYDVQVLGAIVLHEGNLAEMKTGEGKTLTATMPLYLNALSGRGAMLVTTSGYLAKRDGTEMGEVFRFLGLTVGITEGDESKKKLTAKRKRQIYHSDIVYTTNGTLGFDYLIDNLATSAQGKYMRDFHYAIIDEADAVLLDTAQTPLVISGSPRLQSNLLTFADNFVLSLTKGEDYIFEEDKKEIWLTQKGIDVAEAYFSVKNFFSLENFDLVRRVTLALKAHYLFEKGKDYVVDPGKDGEDEVKLLDLGNGRILEGTKLQGGQHQALEAKERVKITDETRAMASITYQNLFLKFPVLAGMTGTGKTVEDEFVETYNMEVIRIPTHRPILREDRKDKIYTTLPEKITASMQLIKQLHAIGQPMLIVTGSVRMSELYSEILLMESIPHSVLNAHNAAKEAQMVAEAGQLGAVTVATNMAGRGTDIKLGEGVAELGGLAVIGTERMANERMDLQMRGRSGRQGDPGFSQFFVSLEDDLLIKHGGDWCQKYFKKHKDACDPLSPKQLSNRRFDRYLTQAQAKSEAVGRSSRQTSLAYDDSVKVQRETIYAQRNRLIYANQDEFHLLDVITGVIDDFLAQEESLSEFVVKRFIFDNLSYHSPMIHQPVDYQNPRQVRSHLLRIAQEELERKKEFLKQDFAQFQRVSILKAIDEAWIEEVDYLQQLRVVVTARSTAQRNPIFEYHREALESYNRMKQSVYQLVVRHVLLSEVSYNKKQEVQIYFA
ncbi:accessory Sec system translocase SecA2 [Streptococcus marmotae]|uniref:accessory Sec system translocase SecA2 n=1 Tax=Streptococcus marmotae TaxID=1825069 RepID=UPI00082EC817|nr:accessory Sec system translocase SecA2 [Streptococcus marmotae]